MPVIAFTGAESDLAFGQELLARVEQRDQRLLEIARTILNASQSQFYGDYVQNALLFLTRAFSAWIKE